MNPKCIHCQGDSWKKGWVPTVKGKKTRYVCHQCGRSFYDKDEVLVPPVAAAQPVARKKSRRRRVKGVLSAGELQRLRDKVRVLREHRKLFDLSGSGEDV